MKSFAAIPGAVDVHLAQVTDTPQLLVDVDRTASQQVGLTQRDVSSDMLVSLASSGQTAPNFWLDPASGVQYAVAVQTPQWRIDSIDALGSVPLTAGPTAVPPESGGASPAPPSSSQTSPRLRARSVRPTSRTTTSRALSTCSSASTEPISARWPRP